MELNIEKFNPKKAQLIELASEAKSIELSDILDEASIEMARKVKKKLVTARNDVKRAGLQMRGEANEFRDEVFRIEKEYLAIVAPQESRLDSFLESVDIAIERKARLALLPSRRERLRAIGGCLDYLDDVALDNHLLDLDGPSFESYVNQRIAEKNEIDRKKIEEDKRILDEEKADLQRKKELDEAEKRGAQKEADKLAVPSQKEAVTTLNNPSIATMAKAPIQPESQFVHTNITDQDTKNRDLIEFVEAQYVVYVQSFEDGEYGRPTMFGFKQFLVMKLTEK